MGYPGSFQNQGLEVGRGQDPPPLPSRLDAAFPGRGAGGEGSTDFWPELLGAAFSP